MSKLLLQKILNNPEKYFNKMELKILKNNITKLETQTKEPKETVKIDDSTNYVYTDGSCINNGKKNASGGYGVFFGDNDKKNISTRMEGKTTNNKAELQAILESLKVIKNLKQKYFIVSDSKYSINCVTKWNKNWIKNNWKTSKGTDVSNKDIIQGILKLMEVVDVEYIHVNSHKTPPTNKNSIEYKHWYGNHMADKLATN